MKPRLMCRHARAEDKTTKRTFGNTVGPEEAWCSISAWGVDEMDRSGSWDSSKAFCKPTDTAYDQIGGPRMVHAACWSHARRQFFEAVQLNPRDPVATPIVAQMDELFAVDADARRKALTPAARHIRRQESGRPLLDDIRNKIHA